MHRRGREIEVEKAFSESRRTCAVGGPISLFPGHSGHIIRRTLLADHVCGRDSSFLKVAVSAAFPRPCFVFRHLTISSLQLGVYEHHLMVGGCLTTSSVCFHLLPLSGYEVIATQGGAIPS